jgi:beta-xylosidase
MRKKRCKKTEFFLIFLLLLFSSDGLFAENPIITSIYTADPAALVYNETFYIYCGHDEAAPGDSNFYMRDWHILSSTDMGNWTDHGACLSVNDFSWAQADAWAGHCVYNNGKFWWYVPVNHRTIGWMSIGVASINNPTGPFTDAKGSAIITDDTPNSSDLNIDPCVFVDDDGQIYMVWGCYWEVRMVKLKSNMIDMDGTPIKPDGVNNFWEAPWLFKRNGTYYLLYAAGANPAEIEYCMAGNPMGPWTHKGVMFGTTSSPTNHPSAVEYKGQWYFVYHTADAPGGGEFRRSVCVDYMYFNSDGTIQRVIATREGVDSVGNITSAPTPAPTSAVKAGDVNGDGNVDIVDALLIAQCYVGIGDCPSLSIGDANCDGSIDIVDALLIAQFYVDLVLQIGC